MIDRRQVWDHVFAEGFILACIILWWAVARQYPVFVLPGPLDVGGALLRFVSEPKLMISVGISMCRVLATVVLSMSIAVGLALLVRAVPVLRETVERRVLAFLSSFPSVGWAIFGVIWFQISTTTVLFIQMMIILPFCIITALQAFQQLDAELDEMGRSFTRNPWRRFGRLTVPLVMPFLTAGLRVAYGICWKIALVAELFGASSGLGYQLLRAQSVSDAPMVFAICLVIVVCYGLTDWLIFRPLAMRFSFNQER